MAKLYTGIDSIVETNMVNSVRTGQVKAQYEFIGDKDDLENGMLLVEDSLNRQIRFPNTGTELCYLHASEERIYESHLGRKTFGLQTDDKPKVYKLKPGDIFETNAVDKGLYANVAAVKADLTNTVFGIPDSSGLIKLVDAATGATALTTHCVVLQVVEFVTLPNHAEGIKFVVKQAKKIARASTLAAVSEFKFVGATNAALEADVTGVIVGSNITLTVPFGTTLTALIANFTVSDDATVKVGTTAQVSGTTPNNFTNPVVYTVTSEAGFVTAQYTATVVVTPAATDSSFASFDLLPEFTGTIGEGTIAVTVPFGTDVTALVADFEVNEFATVKVGATEQVSGTTTNDFTSAVTYTVVAQDDTETEYVVTVTIAAASEEADMLTFGFLADDNVALSADVGGVIVEDIGGNTIAVEVPNGTTVTALVATFTTSEFATTTALATPQVSGTTPNDFTAPMTYTITAQDTITTKDYVVTVTIAS